MFTLPDHLLAFLYLACAAIPRAVEKGTKGRIAHVVVVGDAPGDIADLSSWIFGNISNVVVSSKFSVVRCIIQAHILS